MGRPRLPIGSAKAGPIGPNNNKGQPVRPNDLEKMGRASDPAGRPGPIPS
jgi:hypothetical protein